MIHRFVFHNDKISPVESVRLSPGQAGLFNGWGLFTTMRVHEGIPFAFERHWSRLERDAERTRCPFPFALETVRAQMSELLEANRVVEGAARIYTVYNQVGFWRSAEDFPRVDLLMCSADLPSYREPSRLGMREFGRYAAAPLAGVKVLSWLDNVWNYAEATQAGFDEVVLVERARGSGGMYGGEHFLRARREGGDPAFEFGVFAGDYTGGVAGDWRVGGSGSEGSGVAAGRFV